MLPKIIILVISVPTCFSTTFMSGLLFRLFQHILGFLFSVKVYGVTPPITLVVDMFPIILFADILLFAPSLLLRPFVIQVL